jgi:hypothetical protein
MLQFNALLVARPPWSGLLQDYADDARSFCADLVCAWRIRFSRCIRGDANILRIPQLRFLCSQHRFPLSRPARVSLTCPTASSYLV